jgi:hypothetical protein
MRSGTVSGVASGEPVVRSRVPEDLVDPGNVPLREVV